MKQNGVTSKIVGIALVCLMLGTMLGGLASIDEVFASPESHGKDNIISDVEYRDHQSMSSVGLFNAEISELSAGQIYNFRACASNSEGINYGLEDSFTTLAPEICIPSEPLDFGDVNVGDHEARQLDIYNLGTATLTINSITRTSGSSEFSPLYGYAPFDIEAGSYGATLIFFDPSSEGQKNATFTINSNDPYQPSVTFNVSGNGIPAPTAIYVPDSYSTIQAAVDAASPGDTIVVRDGTYTENVDVNKDHLTIQSENGAEATIIQAANPSDDVFKVTADYVKVSGFTVEGLGYHMTANVWLEANYCNISNNVCSNGGTGIYLYVSTHNNISNNICSNNYGGVRLHASSNNSLSHNECSLNTWDGIFLNNSSNNNSLCNNICSGNWAGIWLQDLSNSNSILNNICSLNSEYGFYLNDSTNNSISSNSCSNNAIGIRLYSASSNDIYLNNFVNNSQIVDSIYGSTNIWNSPEEMTYTYNGNTHTGYVGNHWSDYAGSDNDGDGIGDTPYSIDSDKDNYPLIEPFENYEIGAVPISLHTQLLAVMHPGFGSVADLGDQAHIASSSSPSARQWLQAALATYGISPLEVFMSPADWFMALNRGVVDAVLVRQHPSAPLQEAISSGEVQLLPWSIQAVEAVTGAYPETTMLAQLPPNTYEGQTESILGYAPTDTTPPTVSSVSPQDGAIDVRVDAVVAVTFSEAMDNSTITTSSFTLASSEVSGTVTYDPNTYIAIFTPDANLDFDHQYTATLSTDIRDAAGNPLAEAYSWSFTTTAGELVTFPDPNLETAIREAMGKPTGDIYQSDLEGLIELYASNRSITDLTGLEYCTSLTHLALDNNQIIDISAVSGLANLQELYLAGNQISSISPLGTLTNLRSLGLGGNQIVDISAVSGLANLQGLTLELNRISNISPLAGLRNLTHLHLYENQISDIVALASLTNLQWLNLSGNQIADISILERLTNLSKLEIGFSQVNNLEALSKLVSLEYLDLVGNQISDLQPLSNLINLSYLDVSYAQISRLQPIGNLVNLESLYLSSNEISDLQPLSNLANLRHLGLSLNQISDLQPLVSLNGLRFLGLATNQINDIQSVSNLANLLVLSISRNKVSNIAPLAELAELRILMLRDNNVVNVTPLSVLTKLGEDAEGVVWPVLEGGGRMCLDLGNNQVSDISPLVQNEGLNEGDGIDLRGNPLSADSLNTYIPQLEDRGVAILYDVNQPPIADAGSDQSVSSGELVYFDGSNSYDPDGTIVSYEWDFGDGDTAEGHIVNHRFRGAMNEPRTYTVTLTVEDNSGNTATDTVAVTVVPLEKTVEVSHQPTVPIPGQPVFGRMTASYNWIHDNTYVVSKIHYESSGFVGVGVISIWDYHLHVLPVPIWTADIFSFGRDKEKTYYPDLAQIEYGGDTFEGISVDAFDVMNIFIEGWAGISISIGPSLPVPFFETNSACFQPDYAEVPDHPVNISNMDLIQLGSPGEVRVYNAEGRVTGLVNGEVREEIPQSAYDDGTIIIIYSSSGSYKYEVEGTDEGTYGLQLIHVEEVQTATFTATDIPISGNATHQYTIDWDALSVGEKGVTIKIDSDGDGQFEEIVITTPSHMPSNPSPSNHATNTDGNAELSWIGGDPDEGDSVTYKVYLGTDENPPLISDNQTGITYDPNTLSYSTKYYWRVVARDNHGITTQGPIWSFTTRSRPGGGGGGGGIGVRDTSPPSLSDISASNITKTSVDIYWTTDEKSDSQAEYWSSPHMFSELDEEMVLHHHIHLTDLNPATNYYYKTMSRDRAGNLAVSAGFTFSTLGTPATFATSALAISPTEVDIGESVTLSVLVDNTSDAKGTYEVTLKIDNTVVATKEVTLAGGASRTVTFTLAEDVAGTYTVAVNGLTGTFVVKAPATFTISALAISPAEVDIGEDITVSALVTNTGDLTGTYEVTLKIDNAVVATKEVTLVGGASERVTFTTSKDVAATYTINLNGLSGTFMVKAGPNWWLIGGIITAVVAALVYLFIRRRGKR